MLLLIWITTCVLLACWSAAGLGLHALFTAGPGWLEALPGWIDRLPYPALLERLLPQWQDLLMESARLLQATLGWLGPAGAVAVVVVWAGGALLLVVLALGLTFVVRRHSRRITSLPG